MAFHEVRFPAALSLGATGGPERRTEIVTLANGFEERNSPWAHARRRYDAGVAMRSLDDLHEVLAFFEARQGQLHGFRWKDWADWKSCPPLQQVRFDDQQIGVGDGVTAEFALRKTYASGAQSYARPIAKPVASTVRVGVQREELELGEFEVDPVAGLVRFAEPPDEGSAVLAGFEFDVPVRFDTGRIDISVASFRAGDVPGVPIVEVRV